MNFRRWITALAVLTLFVGLAAAQTSGNGGGTVMNCNAVGQVTPTIRSEGIAELVGDIVITCTGGNSIPAGNAIPQGNIVISLTAPVTSRLQTGAAPTGANGVPSEAVLLIDEPNTQVPGPVAGFGPNSPIIACTTPATGCGAFAQVVGGIPVASSSATAATPTFNLYQGNVSGNTVSFQGIPFLPPATANVVRVYRITNIRVAATGVGGSQVSGLGTVQAYISTNGSSTLPISLALVTVAFVSPSMVPTVNTTGAGSFAQCVVPSPIGNVALLNFAEQFPSAFKTRIAPFSTTANTSYVGTTSAVGYAQQSIPGQLYNSESGFIYPLGSTSGTSIQAGLADFGTRFKAVFSNLPSGATVYVSRYNVTGYGTPAAAPAVVGGFNNPETPYAALTTNGEAGVFTDPTSGLSTPNGVQIYALSGANPTAVWEVINTNTSADETFTFGVYISYPINTTLNVAAPTTPPATGMPSVWLSYAPLQTPVSYTTGTIPRFIQSNLSVPNGIIRISPCQTLLLFPFVTTQAGFDTGIAISNTSTDPLGTTTSGGTCTLNFYGQNAPTAYTTPVIATGTPLPSAATLIASSVAPGFQGYMFASCNFQYAHGFAYITSGSLGTPSVTSMGYLALVVNTTAGSLVRSSSNAFTAEQLDQ